MDFQQRYEFNPKTDLLGKGGFSKVYKATDTLLDRTVALKFFTGTISDKYQVLNEIKKVIRFEHPNLCKYYDVAVLSNKNVVGETERIEVGIMEYIDAGDFKTYTRKNPQHVDKLLIDVLKGLAYLHRHGIAHRDLKPQNILVKTDEDEPVSKITDFGISKLIVSDDANSSTLLGTIEYMAPEQFNPKKYGINGRITTNLDLWSFGLLVYDAVCHESFFGSRSGGISAEQVMANILSEASLAKADTMPAKYREIVKRCLVKNAAERVQNALELIPLFESKTIPVAEVRTNQEYKSHEVNAEVTKVIEAELPLKEETQNSNATQEIPAEETQVIDLAPEASTEKTPVIESVTGATSEDTQAIAQTPDETAETQVIGPFSESATIETQVVESLPPATAEITQVIEPISNAKEERTEIIYSNETKPVLKEETANEQLIRNKKEVVKARPVKKIIILSSLAVLLIILFIAYPFLSQPNLPTETKPVDETVFPSPPVEDWKPEIIPIRGGTFIMGDIDANVVSSAVYAHVVALRDFSLGKYEVTVAQFKKFIDETGYTTTAQQKGSSQIFVEGKWLDSSGIDWRYDVRGNLINSNSKNIPVVHVSWTDANAYCKWLSEKTNESYRLLTEAEWEFAARGGNNSKQYSFSGSDTLNQVAWYQKNSDGSIHPIGTKKPNELGIYDMSGNALEWCNDWYDKEYYKNSPPENPKGPGSPARDSVKVLRGGAWAYEGKLSRNVHRTKLKADVIGGSTGFRVCRVNN
ncbi:MAG: SUMF1/EgtB/PvdO family nonheme iron enzyme [Chitinophagaceae bacterium]